MNEQNEQIDDHQPTVQEIVSVTIAQIAIGLMLKDVPDDVLENMFNQIAVINGVSKTIFLSAFDSIHGIDYIRELGEQWLENGSHHLSNIINHPINNSEVIKP